MHTAFELCPMWIWTMKSWEWPGDEAPASVKTVWYLVNPCSDIVYGAKGFWNSKFWGSMPTELYSMFLWLYTCMMTLYLDPLYISTRVQCHNKRKRVSNVLYAARSMCFQSNMTFCFSHVTMPSTESRVSLWLWRKDMFFVIFVIYSAWTRFVSFSMHLQSLERSHYCTRNHTYSLSSCSKCECSTKWNCLRSVTQNKRPGRRRHRNHRKHVPSSRL